MRDVELWECGMRNIHMFNLWPWELDVARDAETFNRMLRLEVATRPGEDQEGGWGRNCEQGNYGIGIVGSWDPWFGSIFFFYDLVNIVVSCLHGTVHSSVRSFCL